MCTLHKLDFQQCHRSNVKLSINDSIFTLEYTQAYLYTSSLYCGIFLPEKNDQRATPKIAVGLWIYVYHYHMYTEEQGSAFSKPEHFWPNPGLQAYSLSKEQNKTVQGIFLIYPVCDKLNKYTYIRMKQRIQCSIHTITLTSTNLHNQFYLHNFRE